MLGAMQKSLPETRRCEGSGDAKVESQKTLPEMRRCEGSGDAKMRGKRRCESGVAENASGDASFASDMRTHGRCVGLEHACASNVPKESQVK